MSCIQNMPAHEVKDSVQVNEMRAKIHKLNEPLAKIMCLMNQTANDLKSRKGKSQDYMVCNSFLHFVKQLCMRTTFNGIVQQAK